MKNKNIQLIKLLVALLLGTFFGLLFPEKADTMSVVTVWAWKGLHLFHDIFIKGVGAFVPFIVFGFVASSIMKANGGAAKLLGATMGLSLLSTLLAGFVALGIASATFPAMIEVGMAETHTVAKTANFGAAVPTFIALSASVLLGLVASGVKEARAAELLEKIRKFMSGVVAKVMSLLMPFYVFTTMANMAASGRFQKLGMNGAKIMLVAAVTTMVMMAMLYMIAGMVSRRSPLKALSHMLPAYLAGCGSCSSVASIPYTLKQVKENGVSDETAELVIPLCSSVHHVGSVATLVVYMVGLVAMGGGTVSVQSMDQYVLMVSLVSFLTPGIPGGVVLASAWGAQSVLGFGAEQYAVVVAIYLALDGIGTACNLTCDGAIAMVVEKKVRKWNVGRIPAPFPSVAVFTRNMPDTFRNVA